MGGGGSKAQSVSDTLNMMCNTVITNTINTCSSSVSQTQTQVVNDTNLFGSLDATQKQTTTVDMSCVTNANMQNVMATNVATALQQTSSASGTAGISALGASSSSDINYLKNIIQNNTTNNTTQQMETNLEQSQGQIVNTTGIIKFVGATQEQSAKVIAEAILKTDGYVNAINTTTNAITQVSTAVTTNPVADIINSAGNIISGLGETVSGLFGSAKYIIIVLIVIACVVVFFLWRSGFFNKYGFPPPK